MKSQTFAEVWWLEDPWEESCALPSWVYKSSCQRLVPCSPVLVMFSDSVTKAVSDADRKKILELEETELTLRQEISKLKVPSLLCVCVRVCVCVWISTGWRWGNYYVRDIISLNTVSKILRLWSNLPLLYCQRWNWCQCRLCLCKQFYC